MSLLSSYLIASGNDALCALDIMIQHTTFVEGSKPKRIEKTVDSGGFALAAGVYLCTSSEWKGQYSVEALRIPKEMSAHTLIRLCLEATNYCFWRIPGND